MLAGTSANVSVATATASPQELVVFARGMANFDRNRGTKADRVDPRHGFLGAFEDSGNYAFIGSFGAKSLREAALAARSHRTATRIVTLTNEPPEQSAQVRIRR